MLGAKRTDRNSGGASMLELDEADFPAVKGGEWAGDESV